MSPIGYQSPLNRGYFCRTLLPISRGKVDFRGIGEALFSEGGIIKIRGWKWGGFMAGLAGLCWVNVGIVVNFSGDEPLTF